MPRRPASAALAPLCVLLLAACGGGSSGAGSAPGAEAAATAAPQEATSQPASVPAASAANRDWPTFGGDAARTSVVRGSTGLTAAGVKRLERRRIRLPGTVDSAPIYLHGVEAGGARRDVFVLTTTYGRTLAVDAVRGRILWTFTPPGSARLVGTPQITQASPVASADRAYVFSASPDGLVHKLAVADGREAAGFPVSVTLDPTHEKLTSSFNLVAGRLFVVTGGYIGDAPPYQGHVVRIDPGSGRIEAVFNDLCADVRRIMRPSSCRSTMAAIWGRAGAVATGRGTLLVSSGNGPYDGRRDFGDSVMELGVGDLGLRRHWAPPDQRALEVSDADLGSVSPVPVPGGVLQSGKAGRIDVLSTRLRSRARVANPGRAAMFAHPAVWTRSGRTTVFAATGAATSAYDWARGRLTRRWSAPEAGTSPLIAGGLAFVYDPGGRLVVRSASSGRVVARLAAGPGHWQSPVIGGGRIALPEGNGNEHSGSGVLNLYVRR